MSRYIVKVFRKTKTPYNLERREYKFVTEQYNKIPPPSILKRYPLHPKINQVINQLKSI